MSDSTVSCRGVTPRSSEPLRPRHTSYWRRPTMRDLVGTADTQFQQQVIRKVARRLIPVMCLLYFINYLDRVNVGFAALTMNRDLGLTTTMFGLGAGMFFIGYFL